MRSAYRVLASLISIGVLVQAMAIALAWFLVLHDLDQGGIYSESSGYNFGHAVHSIVGLGLIPLSALALLVVSFFTRIPGGVKWALIVFGLVALQILLAIVSYGVPWIGALHGANALAILATAGMAARRASASAATPTVTEATI